MLSLSRVRATFVAAAFLGVTFTLVPARPANAIVNSEAPNLPLTVQLVSIGETKHGYDTTKLFGFMYGSSMPAEAKHLTTTYGALPVANFFTLMNFSIDDVLKFVKRDGLKLPPATTLSRNAFDKALREAGIAPSGKYDVGYMLEGLITHKYHHELMADLFAKYPKKEVASFHIVLSHVITDTASARTPAT